MSRSDMNALLDDGIKTATHFLEERGEFFPFAVVKTNRGEIRHVQLLSDGARPEGDDVIERITASLRQGAIEGKYVCAAIISNVRLSDKEFGSHSDAIRAEIDDVEADPVGCYLPYELVAGQLTVGELTATRGTGGIFPAR